MSESPPEKPASAKATGLVAICIFSSRIMGLLRDMLLAYFFEKKWRDAFLVAFRTPNMLRDLFAEGALSTAFVSQFSKEMKTSGDQSAWALAHKMLTLAVVFMSLIALGGVLLAPVLVRVLSPGWDEWKLQFTVLLAQIMYPFILLVSLAALVMGMLNARKVYAVPAMASTFFNITSIVLGFGLGWIFREEVDGKMVFAAKSMICFSVGTLLGGLVQLCVQLPSLRRAGYRFRWDTSIHQIAYEGVQKITSMLGIASVIGALGLGLGGALLISWLPQGVAEKVTLFGSHLPRVASSLLWLASGALFLFGFLVKEGKRSWAQAGWVIMGTVFCLLYQRNPGAFLHKEWIPIDLLGFTCYAGARHHMQTGSLEKQAEVGKVLGLMWPAVIAGSAVQVNVLLNTMFASCLEVKDGPVVWLNNAFRLMQLPLGMFGVAVATVTLPVLARVATKGITQEFRDALGAGNRLVLFLTLPCAVGLFLLAQPIISLLFERGKFNIDERIATAAALQWYAVGLIFYSMIKVIQPAFTAVDKRFFPMFVAIISIAVNALLNTVFVFWLKKDHSYLALTTAVVASANFGVLYWGLSKHCGGLETPKLLSTLKRLLVPTVALGVVCFLFWHFSEYAWNHQFNFILKTLSLLGSIGIAGGAYFALSALFHVDEAKQFLGIVQRKLRR